MDKDKKYALLDTDFLYKSHLAKTKENCTLADLVMGFEEYEFFCHEIIKEELTRHVIYPDPNPWLEERIRDGRVRLYSDRDIIYELSKVYGDAATSMYMTLPESSCEILNAAFFELYYGSLREMKNTQNIETFLLALKECDDSVPRKNGLGEKRHMF